ncbi:MAG: hypothetical protein DI598_16665 [Pseudopedobacter saltans]|uniref:DUF3592 domain-containing protein n=1 Tax=Pseudopedobacter saltans TaxID=151895 RepID=A0A2W5EHX7_9SPHI|nr:MAG: hypothetical protein DI598_16665 [Pseudopedobacter saltans]
MQQISSEKEYLTNGSSMSLTPAGWFLVALLVLSFVLTLKIVKRKNRDSFDDSDDARRKATGCVSIAYVFAVVSCVLVLGVGSLRLLIGSIKDTITVTRYQAKVVDYTSYASTSKNRRTTMYNPVLEFKTEDGTVIKKEADMASSSPPEIGSYRTVGYKDGKNVLVELSPTKYFMLLGLGTMAALLTFAMVGAFNYAFGFSNRVLIKLLFGFLFYYLIPAGMILLFYGCAYAGVYRYLAGERNDMPIWAFLVCSFFSFVLFFSIIGWFQYLFKRNKEIKR